MIAKTQWFTRRKYSGWGVTPTSWEGWVYIGVLAGLFTVFQSLPFWSQTVRIIVTIIWSLFLLADLIPVVLNLHFDERESKIENIAERNAAWTMVAMLALGAAVESVWYGMQGQVHVNWLAMVTLAVGVLVKAVSNFYLQRKDL